MDSWIFNLKMKSMNSQYQKTRVRNRPSHNYNFLRKLLVYTKTLEPVVTDDVGARLNNFWEKGKIQGAVTTRAYDSIFRIAEAQARLNLSNIVTDDIATQTMNWIGLMISQYGKVVVTIRSPRDAAYNAFVDILKHTSIGITITELCARVCKENRHIAEYLGEKWNIEHNHKLRAVTDMLLNHGKIKLVNAKPMVLQYIDKEISSDKSDVSDTTIKASQNNVALSTTDASDVSDTISVNMKKLPAFMTEQNNLQPDISNLSDTAQTNTNKSANVMTEQNNQLSDISDISDTFGDQQIIKEQESCNIYRLGHSDTWACENCRQKGDVHHMRGHLCSGDAK